MVTDFVEIFVFQNFENGLTKNALQGLRVQSFDLFFVCGLVFFVLCNQEASAFKSAFFAWQSKSFVFKVFVKKQMQPQLLLWSGKALFSKPGEYKKHKNLSLSSKKQL